jgi:hypothetical protein
LSAAAKSHLVSILTAVLCAQDREMDPDTAAIKAIAVERRGVGRNALIDVIDTITGGAPPAAEILHSVDVALALRGAPATKGKAKQEDPLLPA